VVIFVTPVVGVVIVVLLLFGRDHGHTAKKIEQYDLWMFLSKEGTTNCRKRLYTFFYFFFCPVSQ